MSKLKVAHFLRDTLYRASSVADVRIRRKWRRQGIPSAVHRRTNSINCSRPHEQQTKEQAKVFKTTRVEQEERERQGDREYD